MMQQFQIEDKELHAHMESLVAWGKERGLEPPDLALVLHISAEIMFKALDMTVESRVHSLDEAVEH